MQISDLKEGPVLNIEDLTVAYKHKNVWLDAVRDVSIQINAGQIYGLVGESGSGKTTIAMAVMRYLGDAGKVLNGKIRFIGRDLLSLNEKEMRDIWGGQMSLVPQNPLSSLNPSIRIGEQLAETLRRHRGLEQTAAKERAIQLLRKVKLPDPERVAEDYPHQISGGMQQRVMIAMAISTTPRLLVLDEPTTSLDVTTQASILDLFRDLIEGSEMAVLYVTHNLGVVAQMCDRVVVLYAGELVEDASLSDLFDLPLHPYTQGLLDSIPKLGQTKKQVQLQSIRGRIPPLGARPPGCVFAPRCPLAIEICSQRPRLISPISQHKVRCHRWEEIATGMVSAKEIQGGAFGSRLRVGIDRPSGKIDQTVLKIDNVSVHFDVRRSLREVLKGESTRKIRAVDDISMDLSRGKTIGLVGESGSGKTTLSRAIVGLVERTDGDMELLDLPLPANLSKRSLDTLRHLQMVLQNPEEALNPYLSVGASLRRPLITMLNKSRKEADTEVAKLLEAVHLPVDYTQRMPNQLSGGEKQRVAIARAFATIPDLLLADEPVSSLDVSVQASILNLMNELQLEHNSTILFISHDLAVVGYLADEIAVIYLGKLMQMSPAEDLFKPPYHPYTEALLSAIPLPEPGRRQLQIHLEGEIPSPADVPPGCPFHTRCPRFLGEVCVNEEPPWQMNESGTRIFCHIPLEELRKTQENVISLIKDFR